MSAEVPLIENVNTEESLFHEMGQMPTFSRTEAVRYDSFETPEVDMDKTTVYLENGKEIEAANYKISTLRKLEGEKVGIVDYEGEPCCCTSLSLRDRLSSRDALEGTEKPEIIHNPEIRVHTVSGVDIETIQTPNNHEPNVKGSQVKSMIVEDSSGNCIDMVDLFPNDWKIIMETTASNKKRPWANPTEKQICTQKIETVNDLLLLIHEYGHCVKETGEDIPEDILTLNRTTSGGSNLTNLRKEDLIKYADYNANREVGAWLSAKDFISSLKEKGFDFGIENDVFERLANNSLASYKKHYNTVGQRLEIDFSDVFTL